MAQNASGIVFDVVDVVMTGHTNNVIKPTPMTVGMGFHRYRHGLSRKPQGSP